MMRGNGWDGRLDRMAQVVVLIMEALRGYEHKFSYGIWGHSGGGVRARSRAAAGASLHSHSARNARRIVVIVVVVAPRRPPSRSWRTTRRRRRRTSA